MKKSVSFLLFFLVFSFFSSGAYSENQPPHLLVTIAPHKFFVEKIAGETVTVDLMVPAGASAHTFEPNPKQMIAASHADIWFRLGEPFENRAIESLRSHNPNFEVVDLRKGLNLIKSDEHGHCCCAASGVDLHYWLSPSLAKQQAATIAEALERRYPQNSEQYKKGLESFLLELDELDQFISQELRGLKNRTIMVSHPAYAYFCRDYGLIQLSIEFEGKDPTPQQLTRIFSKAKETGVKKIYIQKQYSNKGAKLIAEELKAEVVMLDPYSENYISSMKDIANKLATQ
jgi:zinc transport system substrate-binding protein